MSEIVKIRKFILKYKISFLCTILFAFFIYGIRLFKYQISIDTEVIINSFNGQIMAWNSIHRYSLGLIKYLFHLCPFNYYLANFLMIIFFSLSVYFLYYIIDSIFKKSKASNKKIILFTFLIISSPIFAEQFSFTLQCAEVAISLFIFDIGLFFFLKSFQKKRYVILSILCFVIDLGCYQSFMTLLIGMLILVLFIKNQDKIDKDENIYYVCYSVFVIVLSFVGYLVLGKIINSIFNVAATSYLKEQIGWFHQSVLYCFIKIFGFIGKVLIGYGIFYNVSYLICVLLVIRYIFYHRKNMWSCLLSFMYLISPFFLVFFLGHSEVIRAQISLPIVIACILLFMVDFNKFNYKKIFIIVLCFIVVEQSIVTVTLFFSDYQRFLWDKEFSVGLMKKNKLENRRIVFVGSFGYGDKKLLKGETLGSSFFEWDKDSDLGINRRAIGFIQSLGYSVEVPTISDYELAKQITNDVVSENMEIIYQDDMVIVKFPS